MDVAYCMLPEPETLPEPDVLPEPEPETEPLDVEPELPDPESEPELDDEPSRERELDDVPPEPESILPVAAPPLGPLSFTCAWQPAKASAPARIGIANSLFLIRHLLFVFSRAKEIGQFEEKPPKRKNYSHTHWRRCVRFL